MDNSGRDEDCCVRTIVLRTDELVEIGDTLGLSGVV